MDLQSVQVIFSFVFSFVSFIATTKHAECGNNVHNSMASSFGVCVREQESPRIHTGSLPQTEVPTSSRTIDRPNPKSGDVRLKGDCLC